MPVSAADLVSPAMACLRVSIQGVSVAHYAEDLQALVGKLINAFLETRWEWPRQFEQMTPFAFVLTDPQASRMDRRGLRALAAELQLKLFGAEGEGEVSLLLFEGSDVEVHRFASLSADDVERMLDGEDMDPPFEGDLDRIVPERGRSSPDETDDLAVETARKAPPQAAVTLQPAYSGQYLTLTQSFVGSIALCRRSRRDWRAIPDLGASEALAGLPAEAFDEGCLEAALQALAAEAGGLLFIPLSFTSLVRPAGRRAYARFLCHLPVDQRGRLGAAIYDTPRAPSFTALGTIRRFLDPFFGELNLHVRDPAFEVDKLAPDIVSSVTLALHGRDPAERLAAVRRFAQNRDAYKKKRIWAGVGPVLNRAELDVCLQLRIPVVSGPAVAELSPRPVGARAVDSGDLPLR